MLALEIENKLNELKNCHFVNVYLINGVILSCPPENIINYHTQECLDMLNRPVKYADISYIDSFY